MMLAHNVHDVQVFKRHVHANRLERHRQRVADAPSRRKAFCPPLNTRPEHALPGPRRRPAAPRRHRAPRRGRLGLRPRRRARWASTSSRTARSPASAATPTGAVDRRRDRRAASSRASKIGVVAAGHTSVVMAHGRRAHAAGELPAAGAGLRAGQARASPAWSCPTPSTPISASPTRASW